MAAVAAAGAVAVAGVGTIAGVSPTCAASADTVGCSTSGPAVVGQTLHANVTGATGATGSGYLWTYDATGSDSGELQSGSSPDLVVPDKALRHEISLRVRIGASRGCGGGTTAAVTAAGPMTFAVANPQPAPTGEAKPGRRLSTAPLGEPAGTTVSRQWYRISHVGRDHHTRVTPLRGEDSSSYTVRERDKGKQVFATATLSEPGYTTSTVQTAPRRVH